MSEVEDIYQNPEEIEHIIKRPDMFVGSTEIDTNVVPIFVNDKIKFKEVEYSEAFYKIFDEIVVNARDRVIETNEMAKKSKIHVCNTIKIDIDQENGTFSVWNNGESMPVIVHSKAGVYVPHMIFGMLRTGSNFDDTKRKTTGGKNGYGAKLTNIFSSEFSVECIDFSRKKKFYMQWKNNMSEAGEPIITSSNLVPYTCIVYKPDYALFKMEGISDKLFALLKRRVYDLAMSCGPTVKMFFNQEQIKENSVAKYAALYYNDDKVYVDTASNRWQVGVVYTPHVGQCRSISIVNGITTNEGGTHVNSVITSIVNQLKNNIQKGKAKGFILKPDVIKANFTFFIDAVIDDPAFESQSKNKLKTPAGKFGSKYEVSEKMIAQMKKDGIIEALIELANNKAELSLSKTDGKKNGKVKHPKLSSAMYEGKFPECQNVTLVLCEGDSAKGSIIQGIDRDYYSVFPLRGKLLNTRKSSYDKIQNNAEIIMIKKIMGLKHGVKYTDTSQLRCGRIMIMTDQDVDGYHIKGLIMNFINTGWPELSKIDGFIQCLPTPIVIISKKNEKIPFMNLTDFNNWSENNSKAGWKIKYFKGLGTTDPKNTGELWFSKMNERLVNYHWNKEKVIDDEGNKTKIDISTDALLTAFSETTERIAIRKTLINAPNNEPLDPKITEVYVDQFINTEWVEYSKYANTRAIPHLMDGLKTSQRKVIYGSFTYSPNLRKNSTKVNQLSGFITSKADYHHGEVSLQGTIVKMAQTFIGSNNIELLEGEGNFGSRALGGEDSAAVRYISVGLNKIIDSIINPLDFDVLTIQNGDDGPIEPTWYAPIIPLILVNGADGIGTGFSSNVPAFNPIDISNNVRKALEGNKLSKMLPWYRYFKGEIYASGSTYRSKGIYSISSDKKYDIVHITELPIGIWVDNYHAYLINLCDGKVEKEVKKDEKSKNKRNATKASESKTANSSMNQYIVDSIVDFVELNAGDTVNFTIYFKKGTVAKMVKDDILETGLKLDAKCSGTTNMHLYNVDGVITKYNSITNIIKDFVGPRLTVFEKRRLYLLGKWQDEIDVLTWKMKFIMGYLEGKIKIKGKTTKQVHEQLEEQEFPKLIVGNSEKPSYGYTQIGIYHLTIEEIAALQAMIDAKEKEIGILHKKTPKEMFIEELDIFDEAYAKWIKIDTDKNNKQIENMMKEKQRKLKRK